MSVDLVKILCLGNRVTDVSHIFFIFISVTPVFSLFVVTVELGVQFLSRLLYAILYNTNYKMYYVLHVELYLFLEFILHPNFYFQMSDGSNCSSPPAEMGVGLAVVTLFITLMQGW